MNISNVNKRKYKRYDCIVPVEAKKDTVFGESQTTDISRKGLGLLSPKPVSIAEKVVVELELVPGGESVVVIGQVQWVKAIEGSAQYRFGIKFSKVHSGEPSRLTRYFSEE